MKATLALEKMRFASCARVARLLKILPEAARRAVGGEAFLIFPADRNNCGGLAQVTMNGINLTRREIFRGKVSARKNQTNKTDLEERTLIAPNS
jgi:hypothetical protein